MAGTTVSRSLRLALLLLVIGALAVAGAGAKIGDGSATTAEESVTAAALTGKALILDATVSGGESSEEALKAISLGLTVDVVDDAAWGAMTASEFATYRVIILGDPTCGSASALAAAEANRTVWGPQVDGNIIINGTDPVFHSSQGGIDMTNSAVAFAADAEGKTGLYVSLSCYHDSSPPGTPVPVLDPFGTFTVATAGCFNDAHIVASHPALTGLTDDSISDWSCSVHEIFDAWPSTGADAFEVLVIARDAGDVYTAPDGSVGTPYVLARGEGLAAGDISLGPTSATNPIGTEHTVTALVTSGGVPQVGKTVTFTVTSGPHVGTTGTDVTDASGNASFSYTGTAAGTDTIEASFVDSGGGTQTSNAVTKEWTGGAVTHTLTVSVVGSGSVASTPSGIACPTTCVASFADGDEVTLTPTAAGGSTFTGWSGACTGAGACTVTMDGDKTVTATFAGEPPKPKEVEIDGEGHTGVRYPVFIDIGDVERTASGELEGVFEFTSNSRHLDFESTAILTIDRLHNRATFTGTGALNGVGGYTFVVEAVDMRHRNGDPPSRISIEVKDALGMVVYHSNGLRHVHDGEIEIENHADT
jgi:hypothetical protein